MRGMENTSAPRGETPIVGAFMVSLWSPPTLTSHPNPDSLRSKLPEGGVPMLEVPRVRPDVLVLDRRCAVQVGIRRRVQGQDVVPVRASPPCTLTSTQSPLCWREVAL